MTPAQNPTDDDHSAPILHVDMDAFYAAVEVRDRPELRGKPVIVGGLGARSVVTSATYEARAYGVHSAMPVAKALRLCPTAVVVPPVHEKYSAVSKGVMAIFDTITPHVEPLSIDEAFLDVAGSRRRLGTPREIAQLIRSTVEREQGLTCSVGAGENKLVAKIASGRCKPDGLLIVPAGQTQEFLRPLSVRALWGVGEKTATTLDRLGLRTVADIADAGQALLVRALGEAAGRHVYQLATGHDPRAVERVVKEKSIGVSHTFETDIADRQTLERELLRLAHEAARRTRKAGKVAGSVTLTIRYNDFSTITRSRKLRQPSDSGHDIFHGVQTVWNKTSLKTPWVRLLGVRCEALQVADEFHEQLLLGEKPQGWRDAEKAADQATRRFGGSVVKPASLVRGTQGPRRP